MSLGNKLKEVMHPDLAHIISCQDQLHMLLKPAKPSMKPLADFLDQLAHPVRVATIRSLNGGQLKKLYDACQGFRKVTIADVVPPNKGVRNTVRHFGKNSLPAFSIFEKRFMKPEKNSQELWGYNFQSLSKITGPGYFRARDDSDSGEVWIDYHTIPPERPLDWPLLKENTQGLSRFIYGYMVDRLRGITEHVSIGRAWRHDKMQSAWFILCRE